MGGFLILMNVEILLREDTMMMMSTLMTMMMCLADVVDNMQKRMTGGVGKHVCGLKYLNFMVAYN